MSDEEQKKLKHEAFQRRRKQAASSLLLGTEEGRLSCDAGDGAAYESGESRKSAEWAVGGTV
eukprot:13750686-Ditylum_brightwellii.AAC.1